MKTKLLLVIMLCLVAPAVYAGGVTVKRQTGFAQPAGWVDRVSKRGPEWKVLQDRASFYGETTDTTFQLIIFPAPVHYDSAGTWRELKAVSAPDTAAGYNLSVKTGRFSVDIDTTTGAFRFLRDTGSKKGSIRFTPAFSPATVPIEYDLSGKGVKSTYTLNSGNRLAWGYTRTSALDTTDAKGKGKGKLKDSLAQVKAEIQEFTAIDADNKPVPLTATWTADSLIVELNTSGATYPIYVDPSVNDTIISTGSGALMAHDKMTFAGNRDTLNASVLNTWGVGTLFRTGTYDATNKYISRTYLTLKIPTAAAIMVDSARLYIRVGEGTQWAQNFDSLSVFGAWGTWTGATLATSWYSKFQGRTAGGAHTGTNPLASLIHVSKLTSADSGAWKSALFTTAALDTIKAKMDGAGDDTLRLALLGRPDVYNTWTASQQASWHNTSLPYIAIYYQTGTTPFLSTLADTALASAILVGEIDSTGGVNCTARGFQWWIDGDTTTLSKSGSFGIGTFVDTVKALPLSVTVSFRSFATNTNGTSYGSVQTFTTGAGGGGLLKVLGREVNRNVR